jgi:hypothetical protein
MILGMTLFQFKVLHTVLSLIGILSGLNVMSRMVRLRPLGASNTIFLWTTILTSVTGFFFPIVKIGPPHIVGAVSLIVLAAACWALWMGNLYGPWRAVYVVTATIALWLNFMVAIIQAFQKIPPLHRLAPTGAEPIVMAAQAISLLLFALLGWQALRRFHPGGL